MFTLSNLVKRGCNYILFVLLARSMSVSLIGTYSAYLNIISLLILFTNFGFSEYLIVNSTKEKGLKKDSSFFFQISFLIFITLILLTCFFPLQNKILAILITIKIYFETSFYNIILSYFQIKKKINVVTLFNFINALSIIVISVLAYFFNKEIYIYLTGIIIIHLISYIYFLIKIEFNFFSFKELISIIRNISNDLKYYGYSTILAPLYIMGPTVIGSFLLSSEDVAKYQVAYSIANILFLVTVSQIQEGYQIFLEIKEDLNKLKKELIKLGFKVLSINLFFILSIVFFGKKLLVFFFNKTEYVESYYPLLFLMLINLVCMFAALLAIVMILNKDQKLKSKYHLEFVGVSYLSGAILIYFLKLNGLLISYLIIYSYSLFRYFLYLKNKK